MAVDKLEELTNERNGLYAKIKDLGDKRSDWKPEDQSEWNKLNARFDEIEDEAAKLREDLDFEARQSELAERMEQETSRTRTEVGESRQRKAVAEGRELPNEQQRMMALRGVLRSFHDIENDERTADAMKLVNIRGGDGASAGSFSAYHQPYSYRMGAGLYSANNGKSTLKLDSERRALSVGGATAGAELLPEGFVLELERVLLAFGGLRRIARILSTATGNDLPWPTFDDTANTGALLAEAGAIGSSVDPTTGAVTLNAYKYSSKPVLVSAELLEDSAFNLALELASALAIRIGRITSTHYATGTGSGQPQGITVGSSLGVTAASATAITADEVIQLQDSLDESYEMLESVAWAMSKATRTKIRLLKDAENQYLWQPGLRAGEPDELLGKPVGLVHQMPAAASTTVPIVYGAFEKFIIRDAGISRFHRLEELYRANDQTGFVMFSRHDSKVLTSTAFKHLKMAA